METEHFLFVPFQNSVTGTPSRPQIRQISGSFFVIFRRIYGNFMQVWGTSFFDFPSLLFGNVSKTQCFSLALRAGIFFWTIGSVDACTFEFLGYVRHPEEMRGLNFWFWKFDCCGWTVICLSSGWLVNLFLLGWLSFWLKSTGFVLHVVLENGVLTETPGWHQWHDNQLVFLVYIYIYIYIYIYV